MNTCPECGNRKFLFLSWCEHYKGGGEWNETYKKTCTRCGFTQSWVHQCSEIASDEYYFGVKDRTVYLGGEQDTEKGGEVDQIFENRSDVSNIAITIVEINDEIKRYFAKHPEKLYTEISSSRFEQLVADIFKDFGFDVKLTRTTRDGGKDIYAYIRNAICCFLMFIECKRWAPKHHVGVDVVQRLYGVQQAHKANKCMIVTTSFFTKPAIEEAKFYKHQMSLKDYNDLVKWLERYK